MATPIWQGDAEDIPQVDLITVAGVWATSDTVTLTISDKQLVATIGSDFTIEDVVDIIIAMVNGAVLDNDETRTNTGDKIGEFVGIAATKSGTTIVVMTANTAGTPFTLTTSEVTAGTGTATRSSSVANSSKNDWNNADNWDTGVVPVSTDDVIYQNNNVPVKFGLDQNAVALASLTIRQNYTGQIGLPEINTDNSSLPYSEYRGTFLQIASAIIDQGEGEGTGSGRIKIDSGTTSPVAITVTNTGSPVDVDLGAFIWKGTGANVDIVIRVGSVGLGVLDADNATVDQLDIVEGAVNYFQGTVASIFMNGTGTLDISAEITAGLTLKGAATVDVRGLIPGATTGFILEQGTVNVSSPTDTLLALDIFGGAIADFSNSLGVITVTNEVQLHPGGSLLDPLGNLVFTNDINVVGGSLSEVTLDLGKDRVFGVT